MNLAHSWLLIFKWFLIHSDLHDCAAILACSPLELNRLYSAIFIPLDPGTFHFRIIDCCENAPEANKWNQQNETYLVFVTSNVGAYPNKWMKRKSFKNQQCSRLITTPSLYNICADQLGGIEFSPDFSFRSIHYNTKLGSGKLYESFDSRACQRMLNLIIST